MATKYRATVEVRLWKEQTCVGCGCIFQYLFRRKLSATAESAEAARQAVRKQAAEIAERDVDSHPCMVCGLYQPDMVADQNASLHVLIFSGALIGLGAIAMFTYSASFLVPWVALVLGALLLLAHLVVERRNVNRDLARNLEKATADNLKGELRIVRSAPTPAEISDPAGPTWSSAHTVVFILLLGAIALLASAEVLRLACGWPWNHNASPAVAGPGDTVQILFPPKSIP